MGIAMRYGVVAVFAVVLLFFVGLASEMARAASAAIESEIAAAQTRLDDAFAKGDPTEIRSLVTPDHVAVTAFNPVEAPISDQIANLPKSDLSFQGDENRKVFQISENVVLVTQEKLYTGTFDGRPLPPRVLVSAIWVNEGGTWLQRYYQETAVTTQN